MKDISTKALIVEVGSRDCLDAIAISRQFDCEVIAFEPSPPNYFVCSANISRMGSSKVLLGERCLTDISGLVKFGVVASSLYNNPGASSIFEIDFNNRSIIDPDRGRSSIQKYVDVQGVRFDETKYATPQTIFMDVQGAELLVLKGFGTLLQDVQNIVLETSLITTYIGGSIYAEVRDYLKQFGLLYIRSDRYGKKEPRHSGQTNWNGDFNVIFGR